MCTTVVTTEGHWLKTPAELEQAGIPVPDDAKDDDQDPNACLCGVDVELVLQSAGLSWTEDIPGFYDLETK